MGGDRRGHVIPHSFPGLACFPYGLVKMESLQAGRQRVVYLITYSRADVVKFPSKQSFSNAVLQEENRGRNRYNVERFLCAYYISAGQTSLLQVPVSASIFFILYM